MDSDLLRLYREVELPVSSVLVKMHLDGIAVNKAACVKYLAAARNSLASWKSQLNFGSRNLFSAKGTYWFLHDEGVVFPRDIGRGFHIDDEDLKELAQRHGSERAAQILSWRKLTRGVSARFLEKGAAADRVHPVWRMTHVHPPTEIVASDPPVQEHRQEEIPSSSHRPARPHSDKSRLEDMSQQDSGPFEQRSRVDTSVHGRRRPSHPARLRCFLGSRDEAKPINFGIIFGQRAKALANRRDVERAGTAGRSG